MVEMIAVALFQPARRIKTCKAQQRPWPVARPRAISEAECACVTTGEEIQMKKIIVVLLIPLLIGTSVAQDPGWPRELSNPTAKLVYYQPQIDDWTDYRQLSARMAVSLTPIGGQATVGVVSLLAQTDADMDTRTVVLTNLQITRTHFPSLDAGTAERMDQLVRTFLPKTSSVQISVDRVLASLEASKPLSAPGAAVKNDPPKILVSKGTAILLLVEGKPVQAPIEKTKLEFVVNTNWDLFFDKSTSKYYLLNDKQWLSASRLEGPWTVIRTLPQDMSKLPDNPNWADVKKVIPPPPGTGIAVPAVFFSSTPAELITFQGEPRYTKIPGTDLVLATNTESDLFVHSRENQFYFLVAGRWFRAKSLDGPWSYATSDLPVDFARIPPNSSRSRVLASVPGTEEAKDAVLLAQVPNTAVVNRAQAEAQVKVQYEGKPQFQPIEGTSLTYASNTQDKIIKVGDLYYLCFQAVWFVSTSPQGPWKTADSVPKEIYAIPPSSPVYNVTYVTQTKVSDTEVESSQTAGYLGMFIIGAAVGATVAYGSGYYYPPYYYWGPHPYPIYHPYPVTYGVGAVYNPHTGSYGYARGAYGPYGGAGGAAWYNPSTGTYGRAATAYGPYGSRTAASGYNPYTGAHGTTRQGSNAYSQWGSSAVTRGNDWAAGGHVTTSQGTRARYQTSEGGRVVAGSGYRGSGYVGQSGSGDIYAGKDGNAYKKDTSGNWHKYENGNWNTVEHPPKPSPGTQQNIDAAKQRRSAQGPTSSPNNTQQPGRVAGTSQRQQAAAYMPQYDQLNREAQARQRGSQQTQRFQNYQQQGGGGTRGSRSSGGARRRR
jgi:hypothetical protein